MRRNKVGKKEVDLNEMVKVDPNELKEMCQFCMTKNSAAKVWNTDKFLQSEIPRLFKIVTALKVYSAKRIFVFLMIQLIFMPTVGSLVTPVAKPRMLSM